MPAIDPVFNIPGAGFVLVPAGEKRAVEKEWQKNPRTFEGACAHNGNVGIIAGAGLIVLDQDDMQAFNGLTLPATTRWETRPGREACMFRCPDIESGLKSIGKSGNAAQIKLFQDGKPCGEIKTGSAYEIIPPSWKWVMKDDNDGRGEYGAKTDYRLLDNRPPADISLVELLKGLRAIGIGHKQKSRLDENAKALEKMGQTDKLRRLVGGDECSCCGPSRAEAYVQGALDSECRKIEDTEQGDRNNALNNASFSLGQLVSWGVIPEEVMKSRLREAALTAGLDSDEVDKTLQSGFSAGKEHPRPQLEEEENEKLSIATRLVKLALENSELWHSPDQEAFITYRTKDGHKESYKISAKAVKLWLNTLWYDEESKVAGKNAMYEAIETLSGLAMRGPEYTAYVRVGELDGKIYVDLGRPQWECVEISADGWQILDEPPIKFRRPKNMQMLPLPVRGGNWDKFLSLLNLKDKRSKILIIAWLMQAYWPAGPYSHLDITGVQGSGKTFLQEMLKMLVDPSISNLRRPPRDERDLMISATNERIPSFDNLSGMPAHLADAFCCLSTGGHLVHGSYILTMKRPLSHV